jgi:sugar lactone lactonase YvrE
VLVNASAPGQINPSYAWRTLTGQAGGAGNANGTGTAARFLNPSGVAVDGAGNVYVADSGNNTIRKITSGGVVTTLAGSPGVSGSADGTNNTALFNHPSGVAADNAGNVYVADTYNCTIRMVTSGGVVTTLAGNPGQVGYADGTNNSAQFNFPLGLAVDRAGNIYVADSANNTIRMVTSAGVVTTLAGSPVQLSGSADGTNSTARFYYPSSVAVDAAGDIYVADLDNDTIRQVTSAGAVTTLAGRAGISGSTNGTGTAALFNNPSGVAVDNTGNVYVADTANNTIRKVTTNGVVTTLAGSAGVPGSADGTNSRAEFDYPYDVAVDRSGKLYVADFGNSAIREVTDGGVVTTLAGSAEQSGSTDVMGSTARFNHPVGVTADSAGNMYVADTDNSTIRKVTTNGVVTTLAGSVGVTGSTNGTGSAALFNKPSGLTVDSSGNIYVADTGNNTIRKVTSSGVVTTLAGNPGQSGSLDGTNNTALFNEPSGLAVDSAGNIYVADTGNSTLRVVTSIGVVTTLAGSAGVTGSTNAMGSAALFNHPIGVAVGGTGNIYVADFGNSTIRMATTNGVVTTLAGSAGQPGSMDGTNGTARFANPFGVTVDNAGNVYVADTENSTIRMVTSEGVVTTLAGTAGHPGSADATGSVARFYAPTGVAVDRTGNVYVADDGNSTIRKVTSGGMVTTLAGMAGQIGSADVIVGAARYFNPDGVAVDTAGNVYVADTYNSTIRRETSDGAVTTLAGAPGQTGSSDGTNNLAQFNYPCGVAVDRAGDVYVADTYNSTIRKVTSRGVVTTLAGNPGQFGFANGTGSSALFSYPSGVAVDGAGNVYVADSGNNLIRMISTNGEVTTLAGGEGLFNDPSGVAVDGAGNVYVTDAGSNLIQEVTSGGVVMTLAGSSGVSGSVDGTNSAALFNSPRGVAVDSAGTVYVADTGNNTIRKLTSNGTVTTIGGSAGVIGGADGIGGLANFSGPSGIAVDGSGRVCVADGGNDRISLGTPMPFMSIVMSATGFIVTWPAPLPGFMPQQNPDISNPGGWLTISNGINDGETSNSITIPSPAGNVFFRLMAN